MQKFNFGKKVQFYREKQKMTQEQLSELIGKSQNFISAVERGRKSPSFETLICLIDALAVTADDLFEGTIKNSHKIQENELSKRLEKLSPENRSQVLAVVAAMLDNMR